MYDIITQAVGIVAAAATILSYQFKDNRRLYICQSIGGLLFSVNFFMLGAYTAAIFNFINLFRGGLLATGKCKSYWFAGLLMSAYTVVTVFTYDSWLSLLILVAQLVGTLSLWTRKGKCIRMWQLIVVSPIWLINNILCLSLGGIITETVSILSVIVSLIRYRKGFEETSNV